MIQGLILYAENEQEQTPLSLAEERYQAVFRAWDEAVTNAFCHGEPDALFEHQRQMALETATYAMIISFADQISLDEAHDGIEASLLEKSLQRRYECRAR